MRGDDVFRILRGLIFENFRQKVFSVALAVVLWWYVAGESKVQVGFAVPLEIRNVPPGMTVANKVERQVEVRLSGPPFLLTNLPRSDVSASLDLAAARAGRQVIPLDARSVRVPPGVRVQRIYPTSVEVVLARLERRMLPVSARITGPKSVRQRIARVEVEPAAVEVEGLPEELDKLERVFTEPIDPGGAGQTFEASARVDLRDSHAKIVRDPMVRVTVHFRR